LEGSVFIAGAVVQWLRDQIKVIKGSSQTEQAIARTEDSAGVYVVPAFSGLGAPHWRPDARGTITGLTRGSNADHIIRAAVESIAFQSRDVFDAMKKDAGMNIRALNVDGGACRNDFLMQFQADLLGCQVVRPKMIDSTVAGAAHLAGVMAGLWSVKDLAAMRGTEKVFRPSMPKHLVQLKYQGWQKALSQTLAV
jgi:glycerol kinase